MYKRQVLISQEGRQYVYVVDSIDGSSVVLDDQLSTDGGTTQQELGSTVQKVMLVVPVIGYVSMALRSTEGLIIVGLAVVFVIILFILAEVWKKDDDEEEDEELSLIHIWHDVFYYDFQYGCRYSQIV